MYYLLWFGNDIDYFISMNPLKRLKLLKADLRKSYNWLYNVIPTLYHYNSTLDSSMKYLEMRRETLITIEEQKKLISECRKDISIYKKSLTLIVL